MSRLQRRDFLKFAALVSASAVMPKFANALAAPFPQIPNILVLVCDAMSARNLSLYSYPRQTTPQFLNFANQALVYHHHAAGGNFTSPGTATLLTGTYPWTHRAINQSGIVLRHLASHNVFSLLKEKYTTFAYTQNSWAEYLLSQFEADIDLHLLPRSFSAADSSLDIISERDANVGRRALDDFLLQTGETPASLVFGPLNKQLFLYRLSKVSTKGYPRGLPYDVTHPTYFRLEDIFSGMASQIIDLDSFSSPFMAYVHLYAPHEPYRARREFKGMFVDDYVPISKPDSRFSDGSSNENLRARRVNYDEYIANVDAEFGQLMDTLKVNGVLDHTVVIVTSDHGELFERGIHGHGTPVLYGPVVHVPMIVYLPGLETRVDIYEPTSNADVLPTLLHLAGLTVPDWCEGEILPGISGTSGSSGRPIFSVEAKENSAFLPLNKVIVAMRKDKYKLICYRGYDVEDQFELFDVDNDLEEMDDLYARLPQVASTMRDELLAHLDKSTQIL